MKVIFVIFWNLLIKYTSVWGLGFWTEEGVLVSKQKGKKFGYQDPGIKMLPKTGN